MHKLLTMAAAVALTLGATQADAGGCRTSDVNGWWKLYGMSTPQIDTGDEPAFTQLWNCALRFDRRGDLTYVKCHAPGDVILPYPSFETMDDYLDGWSKLTVAPGCALRFDLRGEDGEEDRVFRGQLSRDKQTITGIGHAPYSDYPAKTMFTMVKR